MSVDLVMHGGIVVTGVPSAPRVRAVAVHDGYVVALDEDALALLPIARATLDLEGGAVLASFGDGHVHPLWGGVELVGPQVREATTVTELVAAVGAYADAHPELGWIQGGPYDPTLVPGGRFDAAWLDAAVPDRPVVLQSTDHHCLWVNTEALRRSGIDAGTPDPPTGEIARRPDGSALGTLVEWTAMDLVLRHAPSPTAQEREDAVARSTALFAAAGVTWVQEAALSPADVEAYLAAAGAGRLAVRVNIALRADPDRWRSQRGEFLAARHRAAVSSVADQVSVRTVKMFADGVVEAGTAAMLAPYDDLLGSGHTCGLPVWAPDELAVAAAAFDADGFQLHVHAIGDAGVRAALDAVEHVGRVNGPRERRPVIAHTQVVDPADVPRFAALGVIANLEPLWAQLDPLQVDLTAPRLGARADRVAVPDGLAGRLRRGAVDGQRLAGQLLPPAGRSRGRGDPADPGRLTPGRLAAARAAPRRDGVLGLHPGGGLPGVRGGPLGLGHRRPPRRPGVAGPGPHPHRPRRVAVRHGTAHLASREADDRLISW